MDDWHLIDESFFISKLPGNQEWYLPFDVAVYARLPVPLLQDNNSPLSVYLSYVKGNPFFSLHNGMSLNVCLMRNPVSRQW